MSEQFDQVSVIKKANVYFDGKCVSHSVLLADGSRKTLGVILPSTLHFTTAAAETMEIIGGACRVRVDGQDAWTRYGAGQQFSIGANSSFDIEVSDTLDYVCHYG